MSSGPTILISTPVAPSMLVSSRSGLSMAFLTASCALFSPVPKPIPINASPLPFMTVSTSAKSVFWNPVSVISSEIPCTPLHSISSAIM